MDCRSEQYEETTARFWVSELSSGLMQGVGVEWNLEGFLGPLKAMVPWRSSLVLTPLGM